MKPIIDHDTLNHRIQKLRSLGFDDVQADQIATIFFIHPIIGYNTVRISIDFSGISEECFVHYALEQMFLQAYKLGQNNVKSQLQQIIMIQE